MKLYRYRFTSVTAGQPTRKHALFANRSVFEAKVAEWDAKGGRSNAYFESPEDKEANNAPRKPEQIVTQYGETDFPVSTELMTREIAWVSHTIFFFIERPKAEADAELAAGGLEVAK